MATTVARHRAPRSARHRSARTIRGLGGLGRLSPAGSGCSPRHLPTMKSLSRILLEADGKGTCVIPLTLTLILRPLLGKQGGSTNGICSGGRLGSSPSHLRQRQCCRRVDICVHHRQKKSSLCFLLQHSSLTILMQTSGSQSHAEKEREV
jgi:hypothetical protein